MPLIEDTSSLGQGMKRGIDAGDVDRPVKCCTALNTIEAVTGEQKQKSNVTGGTGAYKGARGEMLIHARDAKATAYDFHYRLM